MDDWLLCCPDTDLDIPDFTKRLIITVLQTSMMVYNIFIEKDDEAYAKYSKNNIWLIIEYDEKMESMIELLEDIKRNTDFIGKAGK